jgi:hypothetical protein
MDGCWLPYNGLLSMAHELTELGLKHLREAEVRNGTFGIDFSVPYYQYPRQWTEHISVLVDAILPLLADEDGNQSPFWGSRHEIASYVDACEAQGYCHDLLTRQACARRWMAGKRKVSAPFTKTRKRAALKKRKAMAIVPEALKIIIAQALITPQGEQFKAGNQKALNALVGMVLKQFKYDAAAVKDLIMQKATTIKE